MLALFLICSSQLCTMLVFAFVLFECAVFAKNSENRKRNSQWVSDGWMTCKLSRGHGGMDRALLAFTEIGCMFSNWSLEDL